MNETINSAAGYYVNIFSKKDGFDLFILLNEPNDIPNTDDYIFIENTVTEHISKYGCIDEDKLKIVLEQEFTAGVQIINKSTCYPKL